MGSFLFDFKSKHIYSHTSKKELWEISWVVFDVDYEKVIWCVYKKSFLKYDFFLLKNIVFQEKNVFFIDEEKWEDWFVYDLILKQIRDEDNTILW
jgi:hypothetical protein